MGSVTVAEGVVDRLIYVGADGYTVAILTTGERSETKIGGTVLHGLQPGETVRVDGDWTNSGTLKVDECERVLPATVHAIRRYLGSGLVRGIGRKLADAIVDTFGPDTLDVIDREPRRLMEVHQIGRDRMAKIIAAWADQRAVREVMVFLQGVGVSPALAVRIHRKLGEQSLHVVRNEPYRLVEEVWGIGFATADTIALAAGIPEQSPERMQAAVLHTLLQARTMGGHCFLPVTEVLTHTTAMVAQDEELIRTALHALRRRRKVVQEQIGGREVVFSAHLHQQETMLADNVMRLLGTPSSLPGKPKLDSPELDDTQRQALEMALTNTVSILTGGPGCGKSFTVRHIATTAKAAGAKITLAAPTGRAARRLSELTGMPAMTVHRMLGRNAEPEDDGGLFDVNDPLSADLIVVDESSMLDVGLADALVDKIPAGAHLLLVGDVDQLPSVGPGSVLRDLLDVPDIPRTHLTRVYRQGAGSGITANAVSVRDGVVPVNNPEFWFVPAEEPKDIAETVVDIATRRLPAAYGIEPNKVQVLCPGRARDVGALHIGRLLQDVLNPHRDGDPQYWSDDRAFRVGDRVMPIRNNYDKGRNGVFNGTAGTVTALSLEDRLLEVTLEDGEAVEYDFDELEELAHGYAITVHRSQGSEYPYVVVPLSTSAGMLLLRRNLLYTAITRAKAMVVLVGQPKALRIAVEQTGGRRNTALTWRFTGEDLAAGVLPPLREDHGQVAAF
jgi:exodeoxyribonuclease V alpha subunit